MKNDTPKNVSNSEITVQEALRMNLTILPKGNVYYPKNRALMRLNPLKATAFLMYLAGFKRNQIQERLNISINTVRKYIKQGFEEYPGLRKWV